MSTVPVEPAAGEGRSLSLLDHLEALRRTLLSMGAVLLVATLLCFGFSSQVMQVLLYPARQVQESAVQQCLPEGVRAEQWLAACRWAPQRDSVAAPVRRNLEVRMDPQVLRLAESAALLRAAAVLPPAQRRAFLEETAPAVLPAEDAALCLRLHEGGAPAESPSAVHMMGAFRPGEAFMLSLGVSFFCGVLLSFPLLLWLALRFVMPGLCARERRLLCRAALWGMLLFAAGASFAYAVVLPRVLAFFYDYSQGLGIENDWRIGYYLSFAAKLVLVFGVVAELPVVLIPLIRLRILSYELLRRVRAAVFVGSFALSLLLAPAPDPLTMLLLALPLYLLFEFCVLFAKRVG